MNTGDRVEVDGDYMRILGRESDVINVGGEKVFPAEVEAVLLAADNVAEATVYGVPNAIIGKIPAAYLTLHQEEDAIALKFRLRKHCLSTLKPFQVPMTFTIVPLSEHYSDRIKKSRPESLN
jgi:acyl-coenzyme A synthetase/AMP-(fatty) acid ligase